jgi:hypothetical protein
LEEEEEEEEEEVWEDRDDGDVWFLSTPHQVKTSKKEEKN